MFFVSTVEENDYKELFTGGAWGYFNDLESAIDAVHRNVTDIHETIYPYAVIEELDPGLFPVPKRRLWFGWCEEKWGFYEIDTREFDGKYPDNYSIAMRAIGRKNIAGQERLKDFSASNNSQYFILAKDTKTEKSCHCGFFSDKETTLTLVSKNFQELHNEGYDVVLVECVTPYILPVSQQRIWFQWNAAENRFVQNNTPDKYAEYPTWFPVALG